MKKAVIYIFVIFPILCNAQFSIGLKGGIDFNKFVSSKQDFLTQNTRVGYTGGLFMRFQNKSFFLQPEVNYSLRNGDYSYSSLSNHDTIYSNKTGYIDIAILAGLRFSKHVRLGTGPVFGFLNSDNVHYNIQSTGASVNIDNNVFNKINFCWQVGLNIDIAHFCFDVRYECGVSHAVGSFKLPNSNIILYPEARSNMWIYTVGFKL